VASHSGSVHRREETARHRFHRNYSSYFGSITQRRRQSSCVAQRLNLSSQVSGRVNLCIEVYAIPPFARKKRKDGARSWYKNKRPETEDECLRVSANESRAMARPSCFSKPISSLRRWRRHECIRSKVFPLLTGFNHRWLWRQITGSWRRVAHWS